MQTNKLIAICVFLLIVIYEQHIVGAETRIYHGCGEYTMSDCETPKVAEHRALYYAKENILEQAGVLVRTYTRTQNMQVTDDQVYITTNSVVRIINSNIEKKVLNSADVHIKADLIAEVDTQELKNILDSGTREYCDIGYMILRNDMARIDYESNIIKEKIKRKDTLDKTIKQMKIEMEVKEKEFMANEKIDECFIEYVRGDYNKILKLGKESVELNPKNHIGYLNMANGYSGLGKYDMAFKKYNQAIVLNNQDAKVFRDRGATLFNIKKYEKAILDFTKAINLNKRFADAYYCRAVSYGHLNKYDKALKDMETALEIQPNIIEYEGYMAWLSGRKV